MKNKLLIVDDDQMWTAEIGHIIKEIYPSAEIISVHTKDDALSAIMEHKERLLAVAIDKIIAGVDVGEEIATKAQEVGIENAIIFSGSLESREKIKDLLDRGIHFSDKKDMVDFTQDFLLKLYNNREKEHFDAIQKALLDILNKAQGFSNEQLGYQPRTLYSLIFQAIVQGADQLQATDSGVEALQHSDIIPGLLINLMSRKMLERLMSKDESLKQLLTLSKDVRPGANLVLDFLPIPDDVRKALDLFEERRLEILNKTNSPGDIPHPKHEIDEFLKFGLFQFFKQVAFAKEKS